MHNIALTQWITAELAYKLDIMADEPELQESYGMTQDMTDDLAARLRASAAAGSHALAPCHLTVSPCELEVLRGELDNLEEQANANYQHTACSEELTARNRIRKALADLIRLK
ncbi:hypothetical protein [Stenotrophomonas phage BUCT603B1]|nr:hypothetical protein [Stenotrophomonas phage BUCT603B1]HDS1003804.1 hypothetical protein [Stenotrophomonas maltophilia]